ncbi:MAG: glycoside hydrolase family 2 TIM barrel-domain containing protein [Paludibacter sp.]
MKKSTISLILLVGFLCTTNNNSFFANVRSTYLINSDWKFKEGALPNAYSIWLNDSSWQTVQLPHDAAVSKQFTKENSTSDNGWLPFGEGWYRKDIVIESNAKGKIVSIDFDGVYRAAEVWFNGMYLGKNLNGYCGFEYDVKSFVKYGEKNKIAVKYNNTTKGTSRWYTGEGIYRDVWLKITDKLNIPQFGTYITTPKITEQSALVNIETNVVNSYDEQKFCLLVTEIIDPAGKKVTETKSYVPIGSTENFLFKQEIEVPRPQLWSCEEPNLYKAISKVYDNNIQVDEYETTFGIREIRMTPDKGLLLNGKKIVAMGGNIHHDLGCLGSAALAKGYEHRLALLKKMGCNSVRLSHNPHATVLLDAADKMGILVYDEAYDKWGSQYYGGEATFEDSWKKDLGYLIKRDRNHPSVYIWSMGNETSQQIGNWDKKTETPVAVSDYGVGIYKRMVDFTHALDPSRKVTVALFPAREKAIMEWNHWADYDTFKNSLPAEMAFYGDVVGWNYTENMFKQDHEKFPQLMFIATETGTNLDFGNRKRSWVEMDKNYVIGHYYWSASDYLGESQWPTKVWGRSFYDISDEMTPIGYYYQSFYDKKPMVHIMVYDVDGNRKEWIDKTDNKRWDWYAMSDHWNWKEPTKRLTTFTNAEEVELFLNGKSMGVKKLSDQQQGQMDWEIPYQAGELKAVARNKGVKVAEHSIKTAGKATALSLQTEDKVLKANGLDLSYITVQIVDEKGILVPNQDQQITFSVSGEGYIAGVANGDIFSNEKWVDSIRTTYKGKCQLVVRSTNKKGKITIKATAIGLTENILQINSK